MSLHHSHGHSAVVIGDEGVLLVRDLRSSGAGWARLQGDRPGLLVWPDGHGVAGGLLPGGADAAEVLVGGRRASAVVARGAWITMARLDPPATALPVRYIGPGGAAVGGADAAP